MFKPIAKFFPVVFVVGLLTACVGSSFQHEKLMKGQIVGADEGEVVVCIGKEDGAKEGQTLKVYRYAYGNTAGEEGFTYKRNYIGEVVIDAIVDDHFARASVSSGDVTLHDVIELEE